VPIVLADYANWAALGGAALAGWGAGVFPSLEDALARLQPPVRRVEPVAGRQEMYAERYAAYRRVARALAGAA
jgi:sugar (pentulose or hexulose) kinase